MRTQHWMLAATGVALLSVGCGPAVMPGTPDGAVDPSPSDSGVPDAGVLAHFEADSLPDGAAVWLEVELGDPRAPKVAVWGKGLGPLLGIAFHVGVDPSQLQVQSAGADPVMGLEARYLQRVRGSDVSFGHAHLGAASGETPLTTPTRLALIQLSAPDAVDSRIGLTRLQARRADGTFVPVSVATGRMVVPGATR